MNTELAALQNLCSNGCEFEISLHFDSLRHFGAASLSHCSQRILVAMLLATCDLPMELAFSDFEMWPGWRGTCHCLGRRI